MRPSGSTISSLLSYYIGNGTEMTGEVIDVTIEALAPLQIALDEKETDFA